MKLRWTAVGQSGKTADWAGDGICELLATDDKRTGFGPEGGPGPAALVQFNHETRGGGVPHLQEWLPISELEPVEPFTPAEE